MNKIILTKGLPASGKTTWAKEYCLKNPDFIRVSRDDLRHMRGKYWLPKQEKIITEMVDGCILSAIKAQKNVILDATNLGDQSKNHLKALLEENNLEAKIEYKDFTNVPFSVCVERDRKREDGVGFSVIHRMWDKHLRPKKVKNKSGLQEAFIFDVDGTLAKMGDRSPYDWYKVGEDEVNEPVFKLYEALKEKYKIIIFTGRDGVCEKETREWLKRNSIEFDEFFIRPEGNTEKDSAIKKRMFDEIKNKYNIVAVIDDRDQVVHMWRETGLTCLQVDYGNF